LERSGDLRGHGAEVALVDDAVLARTWEEDLAMTAATTVESAATAVKPAPAETAAMESSPEASLPA